MGSTPEDLHQFLKPVLELIDLRGRAHHDQVAAIKETAKKAAELTEAAVELAAHAEVNTSVLTEKILMLQQHTNDLVNAVAAPTVSVRPLAGMLTVAMGLLWLAPSLSEEDREPLMLKCISTMGEFFEKLNEMGSKPLGPEWMEVAEQLAAIPKQLMRDVGAHFESKKFPSGTQPTGRSA